MKIISFEGIDGVGKSTVINEVYKKLKEKNKNVKLYFEPGSTNTGIQIRNILKNGEQIYTYILQHELN